MALLIHRAGSIGQSELRTLSLRTCLTLLGCVVLGGSLLGGAVGYSIGRAHSGEAVASAPDETRSRYLIDRLGALSARLYRLESEAATIVKRLNLPGLPEASRHAGERTPELPKGAAGGMWLPPREDEGLSAAGMLDHLAIIEAGLSEVQQALGVLDHAATRNTLSSMSNPSRLPVAVNEVGSRFGNRIDPIRGGAAFHNGLDFPAEPGSMVRASAGGRVVSAGYRGDMGNMIEIEHGGGLMTRYGHASRLLVKVGDIVVPGQAIARVGSTGRSTGPHLHFEIVARGRHVDPERYLRGLRVGG